MIDRVLSACLLPKEVLDRLKKVSFSEQFPPDVDLTSIELSVAKFRLACKEDEENLRQDVGTFKSAES